MLGLGWARNIIRRAKENDKRPQAYAAMRTCIDSQSDLHFDGKPLRPAINRLLGYRVHQRMIDALWSEMSPRQRQPGGGFKALWKELSPRQRKAAPSLDAMDPEFLPDPQPGDEMVGLEAYQTDETGAKPHNLVRED